MSIKLRDLIRAVRGCKTAADERALITKESALIRTAFKEEVPEYRHRNVAKLLYIHMLGYPTHFGQMEAIKLLASNRFPEKRIGYLALMLLLDERQEVLTLVTNSLQMDLNSRNPFVVGLALTAVGNISSAELSRDLANEVDRNLRNSNPYIRKKAALCTIRMLRKVPDLIDVFLPHIVVLLTDKNHNVILTGVTLITAVVDIDPAYAEKFARLVPALVKILRKLLMAGYAPEYDIGGVTDPFLQARILYLLRVLGTGNATASETMNNVLAQVATNTETNKNAGNAVLYECVNTIMNVDSEAGLRVLAVNILGKFLGSKDPNIKYVALQTLVKVIHLDVSAVQRHRPVIVECLRDGDVSIRKRALELTYALVNADNVKQLTKEMLNYLALADAETRPDLCIKIASATERFAPNVRWRIDTLITMLSIAGNHVKREIVSQTLYLVAHAQADHSSLVHKLFALAHSAAHSSGEAQQPLLQVAVWAIGEYGEQLLTPPTPSAEETTGPLGDVRTEAEVVKLLDRTLHLYYGNVDTKAMSLTALLKLTARFSDAAQVARIRRLIASYQSASEIELQQRAVEYGVITGVTPLPGLEGKKQELLGPMPLLKEEVLRARAGAATGEATDAHVLSGADQAMNIQERTVPRPAVVTTSAAAPAKHSAANLLDLDSLFNTVTSTAGDLVPTAVADVARVPLETPSPSPIHMGVLAGHPHAGLDALDDLFNSGSAFTASATVPATGATATATASAPAHPLSNIDALFGGPSGGLAALGSPGFPAMAPAAPASGDVFMSAPPATLSASATGLVLPLTFTAFESPNGLKVTMRCEKPLGPSHGSTDILVTFANTGMHGISNFICQAAVPKFIKLTMLPAAGAALPVHGQPITQTIKLENSQQGIKPIAIKLKLLYNLDGRPDQITETTDVKAFPPTL